MGYHLAEHHSEVREFILFHILKNSYSLSNISPRSGGTGLSVKPAQGLHLAYVIISYNCCGSYNSMTNSTTENKFLKFLWDSALELWCSTRSLKKGLNLE